MNRRPTAAARTAPQPDDPRRRRFTRLAWITVGYNLLVILWGAWVRVTGSGAGCGSHWPLCNGEVVPRSPSTETLIELSHRITSGLDGFLVLALVVVAYRVFPRRHRVRVAAVASLIFLLGEVLVGAGLVKFELVADNDSAERALVMAFHLVNTFLLLGALALTALWSGGLWSERLARPVFRRRGRHPGARQAAVAGLLGLGFAGLLLVGMSGAVTALGDTLFPGRTFSWGDLSPTTHLLLRLRVLHPALSIMVGASVLLAGLLVARARPALEVRRWAVAVAVLYLVQLLAGLVNVVLKAPAWMQLTHLLLADLVFIAFVGLAAAALARDAPTGSFRGLRGSRR